jgi:hypothetical protein
MAVDCACNDVISKCYFSPEWAKTHLRASVLKKKFLGSLSLAIREEESKEGGEEVEEEEGKRRDESGGGRGGEEAGGRGGERKREGTPPVSATDLRPR